MITHLTEEERQGAADDTLAPDKSAAVSAHLASCGPCAADVAGVRALLGRVHAAPATATASDESWRAIRERIERDKIVELPGASPASQPSGRGRVFRRSWWLVPAVAAAVIVIALVTRRSTTGAGTSATPLDSAPFVRNAADSSTQYQAEMADLLSELGGDCNVQER